MKKEIICLPWFFSSFSTTKKSCSFCSESICQLRQPILLTPPERPRREFLLCLPGTSQLCLTDLQPSWQRAEQPAEHLLWGQAWSCIRNRIGPPGVHAPPATRVKRISSVDNDRHEKNTALFSFFFFLIWQTIFYSLHLETFDQGRYNFRTWISGVNDWCYFL